MRLEVKAYISGLQLAYQLLSEALSTVSSLQKPEKQCEFLSDVAVKLKEAGQTSWADWALEEALKAYQDIADPRDRSRALSQIVSSMADMGLFDRALEMAKQIIDDEKRNRALKDIAVALVRAGQYSRAISMIDKVESAKLRAEVAKALADLKELERAITLAKPIRLTDHGMSALIYIANKALEAEERALAMRALEEALVGAKTTANIAKLAMIARSFMKIGEAKKAVQIAEEALGLAKDVIDPIERAPVLSRAAVALAEVGRRDLASSAFGEALRIMDEAKFTDKWLMAMNDVVLSLLDVGDFWKARDLIMRANDELRELEGAISFLIREGYRRKVAPYIPAAAQLRAILGATAYLLAMNMAEKGFVREALNMAHKLGKPWDSSISSAVSTVLAEKGDLRQAYDIAMKISDAEGKSKALHNVLLRVLKTGLDYLDWALSLAKSIPDAYIRAKALGDLSAALAKAGPRLPLSTLNFTWPDEIALGQAGVLDIVVEAHRPLSGLSLDFSNWLDQVKVKREIRVPNISAGSQWQAQVKLKPKRPGTMKLPIVLRSLLGYPLELEPKDAAITLQVA